MEMPGAHISFTAVFVMSVCLCVRIATAQNKCDVYPFKLLSQMITYDQGGPPYPLGTNVVVKCDEPGGYTWTGWNGKSLGYYVCRNVNAPVKPGVSTVKPVPIWWKLLGESSCMPKLCPVFKPGPGLVLAKGSLGANASQGWPGQATFRCADGWTPNTGSPNVTCFFNKTSGNTEWAWMGPQLKCTKPCPTFTPGPGLILEDYSLPANGSQLLPAQAWFKCDAANNWDPVVENLQIASPINVGSPIATCTFNDTSGNVTWIQPELKCTKLPTGNVVVWGSNNDSEADVPSSLGGDVKAIAAGNGSSLALRNGTIMAWGKLSSHDMSLVRAISAGLTHGLALDYDGVVEGWGGDVAGQASMYTPTDAEGSQAVAIAAGGFHSLALLADGTVVGWGRDIDGSGQILGLRSLRSVVAIAAGGFHSLALLSNGSVYAAGDDEYGQATVPVLNQTAVAVAAGYQHSLALLADGSVMAWGRNQANQTDVPDSLKGNVTVKAIAIAAGGAHSLALLQDHTVIAWGASNYNQTQVPKSIQSRALTIAAGFQHSMVLVSDKCLVNCTST